MEGIIRPQKLSQPAACLLGLSMSFGREFDSMVRSRLMDITVLVAFGLCMADQNNHLETSQSQLQRQLSKNSTHPWFPHG